MVKVRVVKAINNLQLGDIAEVTVSQFEEYNDHFIQVCHCQKATASFKEWKEQQETKELKQNFKTK